MSLRGQHSTVTESEIQGGEKVPVKRMDTGEELAAASPGFKEWLTRCLLAHCRG
uniref:Uncharacterized protein n=1 Tax=Arundo donax TaxID=35708 RepID=A0A0A8Z842_ARUDO